MKASVLAALALAAVAARASAADEAQYRTCLGSDVLERGANVTWEPQRSMVDAHRRFRTELHVALPEGATRILMYGHGGDLATATFSVVAVRGREGSWHVDGVGQSVGWYPNAQPVPFPRLDRELSVEESHRLDALLADPCLYSGPTFMRDPQIVGGVIVTLEVEMPSRHWIGAWWGLPTSQESATTELIGRQ